ncbi:MAG: hypothetical protein ACKVPX_03050 [Myxococcaceae bacterium]
MRQGLSGLEIGGKALVLVTEPDFDLYRARRVRRLAVDFQEMPGSSPSLVLALEYESDKARYLLELRFDGIRQLAFGEMTPGLFLGELEIEDVRGRQLEGIHFEVTARFENSFVCSCRDISILGFSPLPSPQ